MMTYIIAEIGINHNGSENLARTLIKQAYNSGADAVKFQKEI
jgi:sialic acid synthase SpsE